MGSQNVSWVDGILGYRFCSLWATCSKLVYKLDGARSLEFLFVSDKIERFRRFFFSVFGVWSLYGVGFGDFYFDEGFLARVFDFWFEVEFDPAV